MFRQNYNLDLPVALDITLRRLCMQNDSGIHAPLHGQRRI